NDRSISEGMATTQVRLGAHSATSLHAHLVFVTKYRRKVLREQDSDQCTLRLLLAAGKLGHVYRYESRFERWRPAARPGSWRDRLAAEGGGACPSTLAAISSTRRSSYSAR
ncbi:MAG: hypothetical protein ACYCTL_08305, partial [Acidimicrobiales bacterium]